jgi:hypothetical protein
LKKINLKKFTAKKLVEYICNEICKNYNFPTNYDVENFQELSKNELKKEKEILFLENTLKNFGEILVKQDNITFMDEYTYGVKSFLRNLQNLNNENHITDEQCQNAINYIYESLFLYLEDEYNLLFSYKNIKNENIVFMVLEFLYMSPIYKQLNNFKSTDIRKTFMGRLELSFFNKYQDYKLNREKFKELFMDALINFNYSIHYIINMMIVNKEVEYRNDMITKIYFYFEHLLSSLNKEYEIELNIRKKQQLLSVVLKHFNIEDKLELKVVMNEVISRCSHSKEEIKELLKHDGIKSKGMVDLFLKFINIRNSLHDNGVSNKDEIELQIGQIKFDKVEKGKNNLSMGIMQITILFITSFYTFEQIILKSIESKDYIGDSWVELNQNLEN